MIHVSGSSALARGHASHELGETASPATPPPNAHASIDTGDALARFAAMYGMHPQVHRFYAPPGGAGGTAGAKAHGATSPAPVHDVAKTTQADIDALKKSRDGAERRLGHTIENAKAAYGDLIAKGAKIVVTTSTGNGGQPVMTLTGPGFDPDPNKPARVHTHYHGDNATVGDPTGSKAGTNSRIREVLARDPQTVFVLPEAKNAPAQVDSPRHNNHYKANWDNVSSQVRTTEDALAAAGITNVGKQIVSVHSRGGYVLQRLMTLDPSGGLLRADRLEMHDSLYGSQGAVAKWGATANGKAAQSVIYYRGTNEAGRHAVIEKAFPGEFKKVEMKDQKPLDDMVNPVYRDANGSTHTRTKVWHDADGNKHVSHPVVRKFDPDPHYRATGQFLDAEPGP